MEAAPDIPAETLRMLYTTMVRLRKFEEKVAQLVSSPKEINTPCHLYIGQEAVATGVCSALRKDDYVYSTHRSHGHYLAKGGDMNLLMAELYGKQTGCSRGKGGSMHIASPQMGLPGSSAIVAGTIPIAVGTALAFSIKKKEAVAVAFFGDGAVHEGVFYESLNFASLKKLPVVFICENNLYSTHLGVSACLADTDIYKKAAPFAMSGIRIDGNNAVEVFKAATSAIEDARRGRGPTLIECMTYRWRGHVGSSDDLDKGLRSREELECWMKRDPIRMLESFLLKHGIMSKTQIDQTSRTVMEEVEKAVKFARESPFPDGSSLVRDVFKYV